MKIHHSTESKVVGVRSDKKSISSYKLYQNGFTQNTINKDGNSLNSYTYILDALSQLTTQKMLCFWVLVGGLFLQNYIIDMMLILLK